MDNNKRLENDSSIKIVMDKKEICWINPYYLPFEMTDALCTLIVSDEDIEDAERRLLRFAPFISKFFPETKDNGGIIESPLTEIGNMKKEIESAYNCTISGRLFLKLDSHLAIAGSIKARGGIYEVLKHAEDLAIANGMISESDNYEKFACEKMQNFFSNYTIQVGSTGNLGISIGIMSAALGFNVIIHMSADAKQWKKDLLRSKGVEVIEYNDDYSYAVAEGRRDSLTDPKSYFVDDEKSIDLFIGYAVAAKRLKNQLDAKGITVSKDSPLIVYIPAGVGGAPGGICYGLKRIFKDNVHCFFVEPTLYPSVLLGVATQNHEKVNVHNYAIYGNTEADGLACASPSGFVTRIVTNLVSGVFTVEDKKLYDYLRLLDKSEGIRIEPSSCAAFEGVISLLNYNNVRDYCLTNGLTTEILNNSTQIAWATGGRLVPDEMYDIYLKTYMD